MKTPTAVFPFLRLVLPVALRPGLVKLLALSNFQTRRRALGCYGVRVRCSTLFNKISKLESSAHMSFLLNVFAFEHNLSSSLSCEQLTEGVSENYPKLLGPLGDLLGLHHVQVTDLFHLLLLSHEVH